MKSKRMTYALIISVIAVWGIIFYRIFAAVGEETVIARTESFVSGSYDSLDEYKIKDTFTLAVNYRDPFTGSMPSAETKAPGILQASPSVDFAVKRVSPPPVNWDIIKYTGYVINPTMKKKVALLVIGGRECMIGEGQKVDGVRVLKSYRDSVKISYQNKVKNIKVE